MADDQANLLAEAYRRNLLPPDMKAVYEEAQKRGLVSHPRGFVDTAARTIDDVVRAIARGATFGYIDEAAAKLNELTGLGGSYEQNLQKEQQRTGSMSAAVRIPGEIGGAVAGTIATAPVRAPIAAATGIARLPGLARAALGGAAVGAGFGSEEAGPGNRLAGGVEGAVTGAIVGPAVVGAGRVAGRVATNVLSPARAAQADIERALARDEITPEHAQQLAQTLGTDRPGATLADVGGENVRGLMERVAQTPGAGRSGVTEFLTQRQQQQASRIASDLSELTGTKKSAFDALNDTMNQRATEGKPLYAKAMNFNARADADIVNAWTEATDTGWGRSILNSRTLRQNLQTEYGIKDVTQAPLMVQIDAWKKVADDSIGAAIRAGNNNQARVISAARDAVLDVVKQKNPAYAQALSAWAGKSKYMASIEDGKKILSSKLAPDELQANFSKLGTSEQEAFRIGAVSAVRSKMGNDPANLADMTKYLKSPAVRAKLSAIMPTPQAAAAWNRRLDFEIGSSELVGRSLKGSPTARRLAEQAGAISPASLAGDLVMGMFTGHAPASLLTRIMAGTGAKFVRDTVRSRTDREIARRLTRPLLPPSPGAGAAAPP